MSNSHQPSDMSRNKIFARIRGALGDNAQPTALQEKTDANKRTISDAFLALTQHQPPANPVGVDGLDSPGQLIAHFTDVVERTSAKVFVLDSQDTLPAWFAEQHAQSGQQNLGVYREQTKYLNAINWDTAEGVTYTSDHTITGQWGIVEAKCAIAETGSIVLASSHEHATAAGFLPDNLVVVVKKDTMKPALEDVWGFVYGQEQDLTTVPRAVNIITGPSRTADVEQKVQLGAHGPRELYIAIV